MIKSWFIDKNFTQSERLVIQTADFGGELETLHETEKAVQFKAFSDYGNITFWCPKSCILKAGEVDADMERKATAINKGLDYNEKLLKLAKENGIKGVRKGMKTDTLKKKIREAGIAIPERG